MLISYNIINGNVTIIWLIISGGVIIAANSNKQTKACLRYFLKKSGVIKPSLLKKYTNTGSWNINPLAKQTVVTVEINEFKFI
jgi:hypothetical protein